MVTRSHGVDVWPRRFDVGCPRAPCRDGMQRLVFAAIVRAAGFKVSVEIGRGGIYRTPSRQPDSGVDCRGLRMWQGTASKTKPHGACNRVLAQ